MAVRLFDDDAGLVWGLADIAMHLREHVHTVAHWYWEGHPVSLLPRPDMVCDGEPFWAGHHIKG